MSVLSEFHVRKTPGEIGIEVEVEGDRLPVVFDKFWKVERDGSLRGNAYEYVLNGPVERADVGDALSYLNRRMLDSGAEVLDSGRAGVHIHINVQELSMTQLANFICLYLVFEDMLVDYCGKGRPGNLFCLRARDADYQITNLRRAFLEGDWKYLSSEKIRYASMNTKSLSRFGSLEFRAMRSTTDEEVLVNWIDMLLRLKDAAVKDYPTPPDIVEGASKEGMKEMFSRVFGQDTPLVYSFDSMMDGIRRAQHVAYSQERWGSLDKGENGNAEGLYDLCCEVLPDIDDENFIHSEALSEILDDRRYFGDNMEYTVLILKKYVDYLTREKDIDVDYELIAMLENF